MKRLLSFACLFAIVALPLADSFGGEPVFRLYITRHAQRGPRTQWPEADRDAVMPGELIDGKRVPAEGDSITPLGVRQATALGKHLNALGFKGDIIASQNYRTMQTAFVIAEQLDCDPKISTDINLLDAVGRQGPTNAFPLAELKKRFPTRMTGGNGPDELVPLPEFLDKLLASHPKGQCLIVGHSSSLPEFLGAIDHKMKNRSLRIARTVANCCLFVYDFDENGVCVDSDILNDDFLTPDLLTSNFVPGLTPPRRTVKRNAALIRADKTATTPIVLVSPADGATVPTLTDPQKAYVTLPLADRVPKFADKEFRDKEMGRPEEVVDGETRKAYWPKTLALAWEAESNAVYRIRVVRKSDGAVAFDESAVGGTVYVDNLEIDCEYEWSVSSGKLSASRTFKTEALAPRIVRFPGINNVRDVGGHVGLDGRRAKQGMIFRSAEFNGSASVVYYTREELEAQGLLVEHSEKIDKCQARLDQLLAWQADPGTMDLADEEFVGWCGRHPNEPLAKFLASRIDRAKNDLKNAREPKIEKGRKTGKPNFTAAGREYIRKRFGIRSDIDLRNDKECFGMTVSPLGDDVHWFHYSSAMYGGVVGYGKDAFRNVFRVFLDEANYPIDFHCAAGQDRTGAVAYILGALLGYDEDQLALDWETTGFWNHGNGFNHEKLYNSLVEAFVKKYPAPTVRERVEKFILDLGFAQDDIEKFRSIMLEPAPAR